MTDHPVARPARPPGPRTPGQVAREAYRAAHGTVDRDFDTAAAAVLAHDAAARTARGEVVVEAADLALALHGFDYLSGEAHLVVDAFARLRAILDAHGSGVKS